MWPYWLLFLVPAVQAGLKLGLSSPSQKRPWPLEWRIVFVVLTLLIGLRYEVGADWGAYLLHIEWATTDTFSEALARPDPAFSVLNWIAARLGLGVYLVNSICAALFSFGLIAFCRSQPRPWLTLVVAVPYLITVVAMGYSRQAVAIGLVMLGLRALVNQQSLKFLLWIAIAAAFHKSAVILVPLVLLSGTRSWFLMLLWVGVTATLLFGLLLQEYVDGLTAQFIEAEYESTGASIRVAMNALPAAFFLLRRKRFHLSQAQFTFWTWMALSALAFVPLLYISPSSAAVDRVALYWIPLQLFVWSRLPSAMGRPGESNALWVYLVILYSMAVHFVWLFFAAHAFAWLPYQFYPWVLLWG
jgi:hypothetical protein